MSLSRSAMLLAMAILCACSAEEDLGPVDLDFAGTRIDGTEDPAPEAVASIADIQGALDPEASAAPSNEPEEVASTDTNPAVVDGVPQPEQQPAPVENPPPAPDIQSGPPILTWELITLPDERVDDLVDALLYPEAYSEEERRFPEEIARHDGEVITIEGYMVPLEWAGERVRSLMLVGDLLACCFGAAPEPDAWVEVVMEGEGADYFVQLPVLVTGRFKIEGLDDGTGYAAGCYTMKATSLVLNEGD